MKHVTDQPVPPRERDPSVPEAMEALVMGLLAKDPEDRCGSALELAEDLRKARAAPPPASFAGAARYPETPRGFVSTEGGARPGGSSEGAPRRRRPSAIGLVALAALMALLGAFGWDLTAAREGPKTVGAVTATEGAREGGPAAPEGPREGGTGKGVGSGVPSAELAGGAHVPASSSAPPSASASAAPQAQASQPVESGPRASAPRSPEPPGAAPSASDAGATSTAVVGSAAQEQYR